MVLALPRVVLRQNHFGAAMLYGSLVLQVS